MKLYSCQSSIVLLMSFDFVFIAYLMGSIFELTNLLNLSQQKKKKDQDIVDAKILIGWTKADLQELRDNGWEDHLNKVISFMAAYDCDIPNMKDLYV